MSGILYDVTPTGVKYLPASGAIPTGATGTHHIAGVGPMTGYGSGLVTPSGVTLLPAPADSSLTLLAPIPVVPSVVAVSPPIFTTHHHQALDLVVFRTGDQLSRVTFGKESIVSPPNSYTHVGIIVNHHVIPDEGLIPNVEYVLESIVTKGSFGVIVRPLSASGSGGRTTWYRCRFITIGW